MHRLRGNAAKKLWPPRIPFRVESVVGAARALLSTYGFYRSAATGQAVDGQGNPIPWYTYPAIEYLAGLDWSEKRVWEYGAGNSTLWWAQRAARIVTVEHDNQWLARLDRELRRRGLTNVEFVHWASHHVEQYVQALAVRPESGFDVIVIDGMAREECAHVAAERVATDGVIVLDNSHWCPHSCAYLRERRDGAGGSRFIQVDFHGLQPIVGEASTTTLFLARDFTARPVHGRQPAVPIGGRDYVWDGPPAGRRVHQR